MYNFPDTNSMDSTAVCTFATIIVVIVLIVAKHALFHYLQTSGTQRENKFIPKRATSLLQEAVALLSGDLNSISRIADTVNERGKRIEKAYGEANLRGSVGAELGLREVRLSFAGARRGMSEIVGTIKRLKATLNTMPLTYQNVLGLYRGLRDSDKAFWEAANIFDTVGSRMHSLILADAAPTHSKNVDQVYTQALRQELDSAAAQLHQMSTSFYSLVRSIHFLGSALQLE
ncbi:hypothetical protein ElyMa_002534100 [Elysia marginata]|uniref:Uncharacterized protein n=1 Tax=Elysia marginata TaxID=1093978 RepID=A0AAV4GXI7_9GAST|nr:hypothetical protein ElyMa_002534100 [Elysia marginata]